MEETGRNQTWENPEARQPDSAEISKDARLWAMICHLAGLAGFVVPVIVSGVIAPLIIWLIKKDEDPFIDENGKEVVNFQISISIYSMACIPLVFIVIGVPLLIGVWIFDLVCIIIAALKANEGQHYRYPLTIRLIK